MATLIVLLVGVELLVVLTWLVERLTADARPVPGCGCAGGCRGR